MDWRAEYRQHVSPFVVKLRLQSAKGATRDLDLETALAFPKGQGVYECLSTEADFLIHTAEGESIDGDVLLCVPDKAVAHRLYRRASRHNTLLFTERCDQLCVMCSQPPKDTDDAWLFPLYEQALRLTDTHCLMGITGGEPTLYREQLFRMMENVQLQRPDISYHVLSNGQHFEAEDHARLMRLHQNINVLWGIPLYSHNEDTHNKIVGKSGAYNRVMENLFLLASTNASIELRTVVTAMNVFDLPNLATFIARHLPFISEWVIMGMEPIGYAKANRGQLFFDHSVFPQPLVSAIEISRLRGIRCHLYNIPRCTVPSSVREFCVDSISDWKKKYLPMCDRCIERDACCGFFEWYNPQWKWAGVHPITAKGEGS